MIDGTRPKVLAAKFVAERPVVVPERSIVVRSSSLRVGNRLVMPLEVAQAPSYKLAKELPGGLAGEVGHLSEGRLTITCRYG